MHPLASKIHLVAAWTERIDIFAIEIGSRSNRTHYGSMVSMPYEMVPHDSIMNRSSELR